MAETWKLDAAGKLLLNSSGQVAGCGGGQATPFRRCSDNSLLTSGGNPVVIAGCNPVRFHNTLSGYGGECFYTDPADCRAADPADQLIVATGQFTGCGCSTFFFPCTPVRKCSDNTALTSGGNPVVVGICSVGTRYFQLSGFGTTCYYAVGTECRNQTGSDVAGAITTEYTDCTCVTIFFP